MRNFIYTLFAIFISCNKNTPLSDEENAVNIAEKVWVDAYGSSIYDQKPYNVKKKNDSIFIVYGTFNDTGVGGVAYAEVNIKTKKVIMYTHGE